MIAAGRLHALIESRASGTSMVDMLVKMDQIINAIKSTVPGGDVGRDRTQDRWTRRGVIHRRMGSITVTTRRTSTAPWNPRRQTRTAGLRAQGESEHQSRRLAPAQRCRFPRSPARLIWRGAGPRRVPERGGALGPGNPAGTVSRANGAANRIRVGQKIGQVLVASPVRASRRAGPGRRPSRPRCRGVCGGGR
jgi:hypothetical protein